MQRATARVMLRDLTASGAEKKVSIAAEPQIPEEF
jgi:hypothetical protein